MDGVGPGRRGGSGAGRKDWKLGAVKGRQDVMGSGCVCVWPGGDRPEDGGEAQHLSCLTDGWGKRVPHGQDGPAWTAGFAERSQSRSWGSWVNPSGGRWHLRGLMCLLTAAEMFI